MLAEALKEDQALAFLEPISAYVNVNNLVIKRMTLIKWLAKGKTVNKYKVEYASISCSSSLQTR